ncbi:hypothetical protein KCU95_g13668, partial [Aureobasidium melanogenum]
STYGHSQLKTGHPVRSAIHKQLNGRLVLRWVTTWESLLLCVLPFLFLLPTNVVKQNQLFISSADVMDDTKLLKARVLSRSRQVRVAGVVIVAHGSRDDWHTCMVDCTRVVRL